MPDVEDRLNAQLLDLYGGDPYAGARRASETHRIAHAAGLSGGEQECGGYPSEAVKMHLLGTIVRTMGARRVLEIGGGLGYSALWLADAAGFGCQVETIDRFAEHIALIEKHVAEHEMTGRLVAIYGEGHDVLDRLSGSYDVIHDDGWFGEQPSYYDRMIELLRPGGLLIMSNWFLLEEAALEEPCTDWSQFAGANWREKVNAYARVLSRDERLRVSWLLRPSCIALCYKRTDA